MGSIRELSVAPDQQAPARGLREMSLVNSMTPDQAVANAGRLNGPFEGGIKSAIRASIGGMKGLAAGVVDAYGGDPSDLYAAAERDAQMAEAIGPRVRTLKDINGASDAAAYALGHMGSMVPFVAAGGAGGAAMRGLNRVAGLGMTPGAAAHLGATGAFVPTMAGEQIHQMHQLAPEMSPQDRLVRGLGVGSLQAVAGAVPGAILARPGVAQPFWKGVGTQVAGGAAGMSAIDAIGQANRMDYQPGYQFDPEQNFESAVAGGIGMLPVAVPHALVGQTGQAGQFVKDKMPALPDAERIKNGVVAVGKKAYAAMPEPVRQVADHIAAGGALTKEMADALKPYAEVITGEAKDILKDYWKGLKETGADIKQGFDMKTPMTPEEIATDVYANTVKAAGAATESGRQLVDHIANNAEIPEPVRQIIKKAVDSTKGEDVDALAEILSDKRKWLDDAGKLSPEALGQMEKLQANHRIVNEWAQKARSVVDRADAQGEGEAAAELRSLLARHDEAAKQGKSLTPQENERMFATYRLTKEASGLESDLLNILKFHDDMKAGQDKVGGMLSGKDVQFSRAKQRAAEEQLGLVEKSKAGKEVSLKFREAVRFNIKKFFDQNEAGRELASSGKSLEKISDALVDFSSNLAKGEKGYDQAARRLLTYLRSKMTPKNAEGDPVGDLFINIMDAADAQFGIDSKQAKNIARYRDDSISMRDEALKVRALLKNRDQFAEESRTSDRELYRTIESLLKDIDALNEAEGNRERVQRARDWFDEQAVAAHKAGDREKAFEYRKQSLELDNIMNGMGLDALKRTWVERGVVDEKKFEGLYKTVLKYGKHEDRLTKPERRQADHEISANHAAEEDLDAPGVGRGQAESGKAIKQKEVKGLDGNERGELIEERTTEKYGGNIREQQPAIYWGTNASRSGGHSEADIGAPVAGKNRYNAIEAAHTKYGHRVTRGKSVSVLEWAEDMAARDGKKSDYHFMTEAMERLLAHDAERLAAGVDATTEKYIKARAELAEELKAEWARKGKPELAGGHFFADKMNRAYKYYRMEQHDGSNLAHTAEQLQAFYGNHPGDMEGAVIERMAKREGGVEDKKTGKFIYKLPKAVYEKSLLPVRIGKEMVSIDIARLTADNLKMHQQGDISGVNPKNNAEAVLNAFYESIAAVMTAEGVSATDPLGIRDMSGKPLMSRDPAGHTISGGKVIKVGKHIYFPADMVVLRDLGDVHLRGENDMSGRGVEAGTVRELKNTGDARVWTFGQLTGMTGMVKSRIMRDGVQYIAAADGKVKRTQLSPGKLSEADLATILPAKKDQAARDAAVEARLASGDMSRAVERRGVNSKTEDGLYKDALQKGVARNAATVDGLPRDVNLRAGLARMLERNGIDIHEALTEGKLPKDTAAMLMRELLGELKLTGELTDNPGKFNELVLYHLRPESDSPIPVTLGSLAKAMKDGVTTERDLYDARLQDAVKAAKAAQAQVKEYSARIRRGAAGVEDVTELPGAVRKANKADEHVDSVGKEWSRDLTEAERSLNDIEMALKAVREAADGEATQHDLAEAMRRREPYVNRKAYGQSESGEHVVAGEAPKKAGEIPEPPTPKEVKAAVEADIPALEKLYKRLTEHPDPEVRKYAEGWFEGFNENGDVTPEFKAFLEKKSAARMEAAWAQERATYADSLAQPDVVPGKSAGALPLWQQRLNAKIESTDVRTNQAELETAAFRRENRNILAEARARRQSEKEARAADVQARRAARNEKMNRVNAKKETEAVEVAKQEAETLEQTGFDAKSIVDELLGTRFEDGDPSRVIDLIDGMDSLELRTLATSLPKTETMRGTMGEVLHNALNNRYKEELSAAGVKYNPTTHKFEAAGVQYSRAKAEGDYTNLVHDEKWVRGEVSRMLKDAFGLEMKEGLKDGDGVEVAGAFDGQKLFVNMAEKFNRGEATHHEIWHGVEKLLGDMGENGKAVLDSIHKHVSTPFMKRWLSERVKGEVDEVHLDSVQERAAYVFQKVMAGEKMPLVPETRTRFEKFVEWVRKIAGKVGFGTTTAGERTNDFFKYVKSGDFARDMNNSISVRKGMNEKFGDHAIENTAKAVKPLVEGFEKVLSSTSTRINDLGIKEYSDILEAFSGKSGKGGFALQRNAARLKLANEIGPKLAELTDEQAQAFMTKGEGAAFLEKVRQHMIDSGVEEWQAKEMAKRVDSFNLDKVNDNFEDFVNDLVISGYKGKAGEARRIASEIANKGYFYHPETKLFADHPELADKWTEKSWMERTMRYIDVASNLAARTDTFGAKKKFTGEDGREYWMEEKLQKLLTDGDAKADADGRKLIRDYIASVDGKLGDLSPGLRKLQGGLMLAQNVHALPLMVFSQMLEPLQIAMRSNKMKGSLDSLFRGIKELPRTFEAINKNVAPDYWEKLSYQIGTAPHRIIANVMTDLYNGMHTTGKINKWNEAFFRYNMSEQWNRSMHVEATKQGVEFLRDHAQGTSKHSSRYLEELGLTKEDVKFDGDGNLILNDRVEKALVQFVEESMAHPDAGSNPMWMNDARFALLAQMKRFTFAHTKYILDRGISEYKLGNAFPIMPAMVAMPWMLAADGLRDTLTLKDTSYKNNWSLLDYATHAYERAGLTGRAQFGLDAVHAAGRGGSPVEALGGPSLEMFGNVARGANNGHMLDAMLDYVPGANLLR